MAYIVYDASGNITAQDSGPGGGGGGTGPTGPAGAAGLSVLSGSGAPATALGVVGQPAYVDTTNSLLYGSKTSGGWPAGTVLNASAYSWFSYYGMFIVTASTTARAAFNILARGDMGTATSAVAVANNFVVPYAGTIRQIVITAHCTSDSSHTLYMGRAPAAAGGLVTSTDMLTWTLPPFPVGQSVWTQTYAQNDPTAAVSAGDTLSPAIMFASTAKVIDFQMFIYIACPGVT